MKDTIYSKFHTIMTAYAESNAIITDSRTLTFRQLGAMADRIAHMFPKISPRRVGIMMSHGPEMIASILAVLKMGACYVPVEPGFPPERIRYIMEQAKVDFIITDADYESFPAGQPMLRIPAMAAPTASYRIAPSRPQLPVAEAYILYTSGTTGKPKGVVIENRNVANYARAFKNEFNIGPADVMLQYSVCTFDIFTEEVFAALLNGAAIAIPDAKTHDDMPTLMDFVERHKVTIISGFPYLLLELNKLPELPKSLRLLISGGDVLRASYIDNLKDKIVIYNTYGPSETTVCASYQRCDNIEPLPDGTFPIGHPVLGVKIEILDENLKPVKRGEVGEICISGAGVGRGYLTECPESANFVAMANGTRLYRSGDLGYKAADGNLCFLHRKDKQVMILGKRVECDEVQNVIANCPDVEKSIVVPRTDSKGLSYLVAYIVPKALRSFAIEGLKKRLSSYLTSFMIPEFFVTLSTIPLTPNGKPDIAALPLVAKA